MSGGIERIHDTCAPSPQQDHHDSAMTVTEPLFTAGLLDESDAAARRGDRATLISILMQADKPETDAARSVDTVLAHPSRYGF